MPRRSTTLMALLLMATIGLPAVATESDAEPAEKAEKPAAAEEPAAECSDAEEDREAVCLPDGRTAPRRPRRPLPHPRR